MHSKRSGWNNMIVLRCKYSPLPAFHFTKHGNDWAETRSKRGSFIIYYLTFPNVKQQLLDKLVKKLNFEMLLSSSRIEQYLEAPDATRKAQQNSGTKQYNGIILQAWFTYVIWCFHMHFAVTKREERAFLFLTLVTHLKKHVLYRYCHHKTLSKESN